MTTHKPHLPASLIFASTLAACAADGGNAATELQPMMASVAGAPALGTPARALPMQEQPVMTAAASGNPAAAPSGVTEPASASAQPNMPAPNGTSSANADPMKPPVMPKVTMILESTELNKPSDLAFNPYVEGELWVMNHGDSSALIISGAGGEQQSALKRLDVEGTRHFMPSPTAFAFGQRETTVVDAAKKPVEGTFATCPGVDQPFMGPTLWPSDLRIFGIAKSAREAPFNGPDTGLEGPGSHLDMLHSTPACTGIAWEGQGSIYWTYSGTNNMFVRYDFAKDHGIGNADHSDGSVWRYAVSGIRYVPNVPAHMVYATESKLLYVTDPGNSRVISFDPESAASATSMNARDNLDGLRVAEDRAGGKLEEVIPRSAGLKLPTGIELHEGALYVSDYETSKVHKFSLSGESLAELTIEQAPNGGLTGLAFGPDGKLYVAGMKDNRIFRIDAGL